MLVMLELSYWNGRGIIKAEIVGHSGFVTCIRLGVMLGCIYYTWLIEDYLSLPRSLAFIDPAARSAKMMETSIAVFQL